MANFLLRAETREPGKNLASYIYIYGCVVWFFLFQPGFGLGNKRGKGEGQRIWDLFLFQTDLQGAIVFFACGFWFSFLFVALEWQGLSNGVWWEIGCILGVKQSECSLFLFLFLSSKSNTGFAGGLAILLDGRGGKRVREE